MDVTEELKAYLTYQKSELRVADSLQGVRRSKNQLQVHVEWLGLEDSDRTWEPLTNLVEDVPGMVEEYHLPTVKQDYPSFYEEFKGALQKP